MIPHIQSGLHAVPVKRRQPPDNVPLPRTFLFTDGNKRNSALPFLF